MTALYGLAWLGIILLLRHAHALPNELSRRGICHSRCFGDPGASSSGHGNGGNGQNNNGHNGNNQGNAGGGQQGRPSQRFRNRQPSTSIAFTSGDFDHFSTAFPTFTGRGDYTSMLDPPLDQPIPPLRIIRLPDVHRPTTLFDAANGWPVAITEDWHVWPAAEVIQHEGIFHLNRYVLRGTVGDINIGNFMRNHVGIADGLWHTVQVPLAIEHVGQIGWIVLGHGYSNDHFVARFTPVSRLAYRYTAACQQRRLQVMTLRYNIIVPLPTPPGSPELRPTNRQPDPHFPAIGTDTLDLYPLSSVQWEYFPTRAHAAAQNIREHEFRPSQPGGTTGDVYFSFTLFWEDAPPS